MVTTFPGQLMKTVGEVYAHVDNSGLRRVGVLKRHEVILELDTRSSTSVPSFKRVLCRLGVVWVSVHWTGCLEEGVT